MTTNAWAAGKIVIQPKIHNGFEYNSNFWKSDDNEVSVHTYYIKPGLVFGYETPKTAVHLDTTVNSYWYNDQETPPANVRDASDDNFIGTTTKFDADHQITDRINIGVTDELYVTRDPARSDGNSNSTNRDKYTINYFEPNVYYEFSEKFGFLVKYRNTVTDYEKNLEDSDENRGIFDLYYNLNRRSSVYLDYSVWKRTFDQDSSDYTSNFVSLNYENQFRYFTVQGGAGYHHRSFSDSEEDDLDIFPWNINITGQDPDTTRKTTRSYLSLDVGQRVNDDGSGNQYFTASYIRFEGAYKFLRKFEALVSADFQNSDYENSSRDEDTYRFSGGIGYQVLDYLTLGIEGGVENRDSNISGNDYDDTFVLLTLNFDYDLGSR